MSDQSREGKGTMPEKGTIEDLKVLLLSGSADDTVDVETMLGKADVRATIRRVGEARLLREEVERFAPHLVLVDNAMPGADCSSVLEQAGGLTAVIPFVCMADALSEEEAIGLLRKGASDFVVKYRPGRLAVVVSRIKRDMEERAELKRVEEALRKSEKLLARSQRIAKIGSWSWDLQTDEFTWSDEMYRIFGLDRNTFRPSLPALLKYIHPDDRQLVEEQVEKVRKGSPSFRISHRVVRPDGSTQFILSQGDISSEDEDADAGTCRSMIGMVLDITEQHEADATMTRLMTAIEQAGEAVAIADREGRISFANSAFCDLAGIPQEDIVGKGRELLKKTRHDDAFFRALGNNLRAGNVWSGRIGIRNGSDDDGDIEATVTPVKDTSGSITDYVVVCRNVTDQLRLERQLRQAQKAEALGTLAGGIARDFNNILAAMIGYTEIALDEQEAGKRVRHSMEQVLKAGMRGRELIKQILIFSRRQTQEYRLVSMDPIVLEMLKLIKSTFPSNIDIRYTITAGSPMVLGDPAEIQQALVNICTNAMQAMMESGGVLDIKVSTLDGDASFSRRTGLEEGPYVRISVTDTGTGMEQSAVEHAFDPFFTTRKPGRATGLGLPVALSIVKGHGGTITIESRPGKGSTFHLFLPMVETGSETGEEYPEGRQSGHETILYVDDEEVIVEMARHTLERLGYRVVAVKDPSLALEHFLKDPRDFDLVITDQIMPGMTGTELAKVLLSLRPDIPIILTTGFSETINAAAAKVMGIRAFVMKPLTRAELAETIRRVLEAGDFIERGPSL